MHCFLLFPECKPSLCTHVNFNSSSGSKEVFLEVIC